MVLKQEDFCCYFIIYIIFLLSVFQGEKYIKSTWQPLPAALPRLSLGLSLGLSLDKERVLVELGEDR